MDTLFLTPFLTGLMLAPLAALLGVYVRLRAEWLAAFAYAQVAAAGGVAGAVLDLPMTATALGAALLAGVGKGLAGRAGNDLYALLILLGWSIALALAANSAVGEIAGRALLDGQIFFVGSGHLGAALLLVLIGAVLLRWLSRDLLRAAFFPDHDRANDRPAWHHGLPFDLLVVCTVALVTSALGVMAAFALVFVPAWIAWRLAVGWRHALLLAAGIGAATHTIAFLVALKFDQPYGPTLILILAGASVLRLARRRTTRATEDDRNGADLG